MDGFTRYKRLALLFPLLFVLVGLFLGGIVLAVNESFAAPRELLHDPELRAALGFTFWIAFASTVISTLTGVALALGLRNSRSAMSLLQIPIAMPHLTMAIVLLHLASPSGLISRMAFALGFIQSPAQFPDLVQDPYGLGIILTYWIKETPFLAVTSLALLMRSGRQYEEVAQNLGAGYWDRLRFVTLPLLAPAILPAALIVFAFVFAAFDVPFLLGRSYPTVLSVLAQRYFQSSEIAGRPTAMLVSIFMTFISAGLAAIYLQVSGLIRDPKSVVLP